MLKRGKEKPSLRVNVRAFVQEALELYIVYIWSIILSIDHHSYAWTQAKSENEQSSPYRTERFHPAKKTHAQHNSVLELAG